MRPPKPPVQSLPIERALPRELLHRAGLDVMLPTQGPDGFSRYSCETRHCYHKNLCEQAREQSLASALPLRGDFLIADQGCLAALLKRTENDVPESPGSGLHQGLL